VQGVVEDALTTALRLPDAVGVTVAGRTDAGVHARGQVAHADVPLVSWELAGASAVRRLAGLLPADVRVRAVRPAAAGFDARFSALSRRYAYRVCDRPVFADPLLRHMVLWHRRPLEVDAMNAAADLLLGEHDFAAFCRGREGATTVRTLQQLRWSRTRDGTVEASVEADAFCHGMVRSLVGALLAVGEGRREPGWPRTVLDGRVRVPAVTVAPAHGLTLEHVSYPPDGELAARAAVTHARRRPADGSRSDAPGSPGG